MENTKNCNQTRLIKGTYSCDNFSDVYVGDCNGVHKKIAKSSTLASVDFEAKASCNGYLYFVCWSDDAGLNGLLAELHGSNKVLSGAHSKWEVYPTGIDFDTEATRPSEAIVNEQLKKATCKKWKAVTEGPNNDATIFRDYPNIADKAHFIWFDSKKSSGTNAPFSGFNHDEFLIFRFPVKELFREECYNCDLDCECKDDCCCSVCEETISEEQKVLKAEALRKTFVIKGKENNTKRCKTPYASIACSTLDLPTLEPCFYLHWGDGPQDQMGTRDQEVLYITACNPYGNLRFRGLTITKVTIVAKRKVFNPGNHGGTISTPGIVITPVRDVIEKEKATSISEAHNTIQLIPNRLIRFGDLCGCACASQALYLSIQNAVARDYEIHVEYCIDQIEINQDNTGKTLFPITLIKS
ncbi:hypothetical protein [Kordia sp.]|uniref:hypothetical protein n=1 Tax=Kordia sp. TaxID=1965332 RepID=UPI003D29A208